MHFKRGPGRELRSSADEPESIRSLPTSLRLANRYNDKTTTSVGILMLGLMHLFSKIAQDDADQFFDGSSESPLSAPSEA
jgi:hypothetical protein